MLWKISNLSHTIAVPQLFKWKSIFSSKWTSRAHNPSSKPLLIWEESLGPWDDQDQHDKFVRKSLMDRWPETGIGTKTSSKNYCPFVRKTCYLCKAIPLVKFIRMLAWIWEWHVFLVVLIGSTSLLLLSSCTSSLVVLASCPAMAYLALSFFIADQAMPWQISQPFPLFVNYLI